MGTSHSADHSGKSALKNNNTIVLFSLRFILVALVMLSISRLIFIFMYADRVAGLSELNQILWGGLRIDVATLFQILAVPYLLVLLSSLLPQFAALSHRFTRWWCWSFLIVLVLMECATPSFLFEYNTRPNRLFFEYLSSPNEVAGMLFKGYWLQMIVTLFLVSAVAWLTRSWVKSQPILQSGRGFKGTLLLLLLVPVFFVGIRSGFQHRPINPAMVAFSQDRLLNALPLNSTYSVMYAIYQMKNEASASKLYGGIDNDKMIQLIKANMPKQAVFTDTERPTLHTKKASFPFKKKNLIIIVEESLGAQFVGSLGGLPLTPNIDKWKNKSWFFNHLYATGTRSARGLEAITTGFLPSPARAVLKLPKAQENFYTIAQTMKQAIILNIVFTVIAGLILIFHALSSLESILSFIALGVLAIVAAIAYTVGNKPYGYIAFPLFYFIITLILWESGT